MCQCMWDLTAQFFSWFFKTLGKGFGQMICCPFKGAYHLISECLKTNRCMQVSAGVIAALCALPILGNCCKRIPWKKYCKCCGSPDDVEAGHSSEDEESGTSSRSRSRPGSRSRRRSMNSRSRGRSRGKSRSKARGRGKSSPKRKSSP